jgi:4-hydroxybenzoate polyprenyltransferase
MLPLIKLLRPHHWTKNLFVFTGILFSHDWENASLWLDVFMTALAFSLTSSAVYVINDIADREQDRLHPEKRRRPIASGAVDLNTARAMGTLVMLAGLGLAYFVSIEALAIIVIYLLMNLAYSAGLKHVAILDVFIIALGFMLRILAGTIGVGIPPSQWLLLCGFMITLFLGFAKRSSEMMALEDAGVDHRKSLEDYNMSLLDLMLGITGAATIMTYSLYTMSESTIAVHGTSQLIYTVPFVTYGIFRYILLLHRHGQGTDPSSDLFKDPQMLITGIGWAVVTFLLMR